MHVPPEAPALAAMLAALHPYARHLVARAARRALLLHADAVAPDHLMLALMSDPECAASAAVLHAFADPATIEEESLATAPGVMVVASDSVRAFSTRGLEVLVHARRASIAAREEFVTETRLLKHAHDALSAELQSVLRTVGFEPDTLAESTTTIAPAHEVDGASFFKHFSPRARQALAAANRVAAELGDATISPADLVLGCLKLADPDGSRRDHGVGFPRARRALAGRTADDTPPNPRDLPLDARLVSFLSGLPPGATSLDMLAHYLAGGTPELAQVLSRHKVTPALLERATGVFDDPPAPPLSAGVNEAT